MKKKLCTYIFLATFFNIQVAYSAIDAVAILQTTMEKVSEIKTKVEEIQKKIQDMQKRLKQGFDMANSCFKNPKKCAMNVGMKAMAIGIKKFPVMPGAQQMQGDLSTKDPEDLNVEILDSYRFKDKGKKTLETANEYQTNINNVMSGEISILFAKGAVVRHLIKAEDDKELYPVISGQDIDKILTPNNKVVLKSAERVLRIIELRSYMFSPEGVATMTRSKAKAEE